MNQEIINFVHVQTAKATGDTKHKPPVSPAEAILLLKLICELLLLRHVQFDFPGKVGLQHIKRKHHTSQNSQNACKRVRMRKSECMHDGDISTERRTEIIYRRRERGESGWCWQASDQLRQRSKSFEFQRIVLSLQQGSELGVHFSTRRYVSISGQQSQFSKLRMRAQCMANGFVRPLIQCAFECA